VNVKSTPETRKDSDITEMYRERNESAIRETEKKYSAYLGKIARNILGNSQDSEEVVNDTYLKAWNSIPPHNPENLATFLGKIVRNLSLNTLRNSSCLKRQGASRAVSLSELEECIPSGGESPEQAVESKLLSDKINEWLEGVPAEIGDVFIGRYFFMDSLKTIATNHDMSESKVKNILYRSRLGLKEFLQKEGFTI
jgi:RNA polymerase sigma-70 factor (ECF subfamily)